MNKTTFVFALFLLIAVVSVAARAGDENDSGLIYDINVITYNVCGLPDFITFNRELADTDRRYSYTGEKLKEYDIIGLQEAFIADREIIEKKLKGHYVVHGTDVGTVKVLGSGVYTFSRWPIHKSHFERWDFIAGKDALSHKGFVAATVEVSRHLTMDVYNLHGQTKWDDKKLKNYAQLADFMDYYSIGKGRPILLIGDFNCRFGKGEVCDYIIERMNMTVAFPESPKVDHIFFNENNSGWKMSVQSAGMAFEEELDGKRLSDRVAVEAVIRLEKE